MIRVVICGVCGKMGKRIAALASRDNDISIVGATEVKGCSFVGVNLGENFGTQNLGVTVSDDLGNSIKKADCVVDFTTPESTMANLKVAGKHGKPIVVGTTGLSSKQIEKIREISNEIPVVYSPNMSVSVNLLFDLVRKASNLLGKDYTVRMEEVHHVHKKDKPSGTGKLLAEIIKSARKDLDDVPIESIRKGEVVGDHKVIFESDQDTLEITHKAKTRDIFAAGALNACKFIVGKKKGLYDMKDVLGL